jgi:aspartate/methionine/tyrosine aminotransferase
MSAGVPRFGLDVASTAEADELSLAYGPSRGLPALCEQLQGVYSPLGSASGELEVVVSCGATEAVASAILGLTVAGERVGFVEPNYPGHVALIEVLGRVPVPVELPVVVDDRWGAAH